jgi:hypothetical protein
LPPVPHFLHPVLRKVYTGRYRRIWGDKRRSASKVYNPA